MATGFNPTNVAAYLKQRYTPDFVETMAFHDHPFLASLKKRPNMGGSTWEVFVMHEDMSAASATFSTAQTNSLTAQTRQVRFALTPVKYYGLATISGDLIRSTKGNENAFREGLNTAIDSTFRRITRGIGQGLYRSGFGAIGNVSAPGASTTLTLTNPEDAVNFGIGDRLQISSSEGAAVFRNAGAVGTVNAVDYSAGTLTMAANVTTTWAAAATGDFIFREGDRQDSATPTRLMPAGVLDWVPDSAPSSTAFFGVDRSVSSRLGGTRHDASALGQNIEEALIDGAIKLSRVGGSPDACYTNPKNFGDLVKLLGSKVHYVDVKAGSSGQIGFRALEVYTPAGTVNVIPDRDCPVNRAFLLDTKTWVLGSMGPVPDFLDDDGLKILRQSNDDGYELRVGCYLNLWCTAPGWNCNIKLA